MELFYLTWEPGEMSVGIPVALMKLLVKCFWSEITWTEDWALVDGNEMDVVIELKCIFWKALFRCKGLIEQS